MEKLTLEVPAMYGDHHVTEVRRILLELPGVQDVYASSAFHVVEVTFDPAQVDAKTITDRLDQAGYLGDLQIPLEVSTPATDHRPGNGVKAQLRHSATYKEAGSMVSFAHRVPYVGRPLWPCPGLGPIRKMDDE